MILKTRHDDDDDIANIRYFIKISFTLHTGDVSVASPTEGGDRKEEDEVGDQH